MYSNFTKDVYPENSFIEITESEEENFSVVIESSKNWFNPDWFKLWNYRELFYFLALRDIKIRYKQTAFGIAWVLLQPIINTIVFSVLFSNIIQSNLLEIPYPVYAFSGFIIWTFVNAAISNSSNSLINHTNLITKVYFPRLIVPLSAVAAVLLDLLFGLASLIVVMTIYGVAPSSSIIFAPFFLILIFLLSTSLGIILSAINVRFRDVKYILPFALQLWLFITPVFYSLKMLPENAQWIWRLNPMTGALEGFRASLFGLPFDFFGISVSVAASIVLLIVSLHLFYRMEDGFADVI